MTQTNHVFLAWQCPGSRKIMPVGRLLSLGTRGYEFTYIQAALKAQSLGFGPLVSFPNFDLVYRSDRLPALFSNRVMPASRPDYPTFVSELGLHTDAKPLEVLGRSGGRRTTDQLEVFGLPSERNDGAFEMHILVRGVRHIEGAEDAIASLTPGEKLLVLRDEQNPHGGHAKLLRTDGCRLVGYLPDYLAYELDHPKEERSMSLTVTVEKVNPSPAPVHHRLLCRVELQTGSSLFTSDDYLPLSSDATPVAA